MSSKAFFLGLIASAMLSVGLSILINLVGPAFALEDVCKTYKCDANGHIIKKHIATPKYEDSAASKDRPRMTIKVTPEHTSTGTGQ